MTKELDASRFEKGWTPPGSKGGMWMRCKCGYWNYANAWEITCESCGRKWTKKGDFFAGEWELTESPGSI